MKVSYKHVTRGAPNGVPGLYQDFDFGFDETLFLLRELKNDRSCLLIRATNSALDFYISETDGKDVLWIELDQQDGLWAVAEINLEIGTEILRMAFADEQFGIHIPLTDREWDAYSIPD